VSEWGKFTVPLFIYNMFEFLVSLKLHTCTIEKFDSNGLV